MLFPYGLFLKDVLQAEELWMAHRSKMDWSKLSKTKGVIELYILVATTEMDYLRPSTW